MSACEFAPIVRNDFLSFSDNDYSRTRDTNAEITKFQKTLLTTFLHQGYIVLSKDKKIYILTRSDQVRRAPIAIEDGFTIRYMVYHHADKIISAFYQPNQDVFKTGICVADQSALTFLRAIVKPTLLWSKAKNTENITCFDLSAQGLAIGVSTGAVYAQGHDAGITQIMPTKSGWGAATAIHSDANQKIIFTAFGNGNIVMFRYQALAETDASEHSYIKPWPLVGCIQTSDSSAITCLQKIDNILICGRENGDVSIILSEDWNAPCVEMGIGDSCHWSSTAVRSVRQADDHLYVAYVDGTLGIATIEENQLIHAGCIQFDETITNLENIGGKVYCTTSTSLYRISKEVTTPEPDTLESVHPEESDETEILLENKKSLLRKIDHKMRCSLN